MFDTIFEWLGDNYPYVVFAVVILLAIFWQKIIASFRKPKKQERRYSDVGLFEEAPTNTSSNLEDQRIIAERWVNFIKQQGLKLREREKELEIQYNRKKMEFSEERKILGLKYNAWASQLNVISEIVAKQKTMEADFQRLKDEASNTVR